MRIADQAHRRSSLTITTQKMKVQINFKVINPDYSQSTADDYNFGKESESNSKYNRVTTYEILNAISIELINQGTYQLRGKFMNGNPFEIPIPNVTIFRCHLENGSSEDFAVSKSVLSKTHQVHNEKYNITRCYFYINQEPKNIAVTNRLILNIAEIPEALITKR